MSTSNFEIRAVDENKGKTVPAHYDICPRGQTESIVTVWGNRALAEEIVEALDRNRAAAQEGGAE